VRVTEEEKEDEEEEEEEEEEEWGNALNFFNHIYTALIYNSFSVDENHKPAFSTAVSYSMIFVLVLLFRLVCIVFNMVGCGKHFDMQLKEAQ